MSKVAHVVVHHRGDLTCLLSDELALHVGDDCVIEIEHVEDYGKVTSLEASEREIEREKRMPRVLRCATLQDHAKQDENELMAKMALDTFSSRAREMKLRLRPLHAHYTFHRDRLAISFSSEEQLDLRQLVHQLQYELSTRIEMRQVGVRDEAGIIGGLGPCGRNLCCATWLHHFRSVNVRMAKAQDLSLNPSAISGMCGRLKCCLRYEYDTYREMGRNLPQEGSRIEWSAGEGVVVGRDILGQRLLVRMPDRRMVHLAMEDVTLVHPPGGRRPHDEGTHGVADEGEDDEPRRRDGRSRGRDVRGGYQRGGGGRGAPFRQTESRPDQGADAVSAAPRPQEHQTTHKSGEPDEHQHRERPESESAGDA